MTEEQAQKLVSMWGVEVTPSDSAAMQANHQNDVTPKKELFSVERTLCSRCKNWYTGGAINKHTRDNCVINPFDSTTWPLLR